MNEKSSQIKTDSHNPKKRNLWRRFLGWLSRTWKRMHPGPLVRKGAAFGIVFLVAFLVVVFGMFVRPGFRGFFDILAGILLAAVVAVLIGLVIGLILKILTVLLRFINWIGLIALAFFIFILNVIIFRSQMALIIGIGVGLAEAILGGAVAFAFSRGFRNAPLVKKVFVVFGILAPMALNVYLIFWIINRGSDKHLIVKKPESLKIESLDLPDPSQPGSYEVNSLAYGSGTDKRRPEFGKEAALRTEPVDATPFVKGSKGWKMKLREWYWGFDFKRFPVNGRVWHPEGEGPFPLVLIVHGNHKMEEYSDPGYAYLGELLASRGFIFVSVDENFFNSSWISNLKKENDGRGWMLLQHLKVWREWNKTEGNPFFGKVDMNNIGLIGHSRGGEAAAIAGSFNRLSHYPDDATVKLDFGFNIKAIVAIAPSDGQYKPAGRLTPLENVNYLVFQGAHDADVSVFMGARQYNRVKFTDGKYWFKAALYSYRSNHGQFNTVWGDGDYGMPWSLLLNRKPLLDGEEQRNISRVYISAFLEATLHNEKAYIPLFRDCRRISAWLPEDIYVNRFEDSTFRTICNFDEDVDVTTTTLKEARIYGDNLALWREADLGFRKGGTKNNNVAYIGWREVKPETPENEIPGYSIELPDNAFTVLKLSRESLFVFSLASADEKPPEPEEEKEKEDVDKEAEREAKKADEKDKEKEKEPIELSVELVASDGRNAKIPLSRFMSVPPVLKSRFTKLKSESSIYGKDNEPTLQTFELPLSLFVKEFPEFNYRLIKAIRFVFDRGPEGVVILDNIGFAEILSQ
jgi:dienelactone hydrolase